MPRKSSVELAVIPVAPGRSRPEPPQDLDDLERTVWNQVVDALPGGWLDLAGQLILRRLAAQAAAAERQEFRLRQLRSQGADGTEDAAELLVAHGAVAKTIAHLLGHLRATPRSRMVPRAAGSRLEEAPRVRPWEKTSDG